MELRWVRMTEEVAAPLVAGLHAEYDRRYGSDNWVMTDAVPEDFDPPSGAFVVVVDGDRTLAGGGLRRIAPGVGEVKRMWTSATRRRSGLASRVLDALEGRAVELGYTTLRLETGPAQPEALEMYRRRGYGEIPVYGRYELATAFERRLTDDGR